MRERNKMLASLLAKQPSSNPQVIPPVPASVISATPQEKLPRIIHPPDAIKNNTTNQGMMNQNAMNNARYALFHECCRVLAMLYNKRR